MFSRRKFFVRCLVLFLVMGAICPLIWADPLATNAGDRQIAMTVAALLQRDHLTRHPLDKEISHRTLTTFLKNLDPMKLYFYQSDIDEFKKQQDGLCDAIRQGDVSLAHTIFRTFLQRADERVRTVDAILAAPIDFTADEDMIVDGKSAHYPTTPAEAADRWRRRVKFDLLLLKTADKKEDKKEGKEAIDKLTRRYHSFSKRMHQTTSEELQEMYLIAFTTAFDPHTDYMSPDTQKNFDIAMSLALEGIGASLQSDDSYTVVKKLIPGGAAAKDGRLKLEDKLVGVGQGDEGEIVDIVDLKINDVVKLVRGKRGTKVRLEVVPADGSGRKVYTIVREKIALNDQAAKGKIFDVGRKPGGAPYRVGVIDLPSFYRDMAGERRGVTDYRSTTRDVHTILEDFKRQGGVDAVVLDLRRNGGGALSEAISLTGLFIRTGPVVQVKDSSGRVQHLDDEDDRIEWSGPLVVMISRFSASASEILAGAIQDYGRGLVVGDRATHGKGTVQSMLDVGQQLFRLQNPPPMGALKITMQQFYRPDGDSTQDRGVVSDIELPSITTHLADIGESDLDYALPFDKVEPAPFQKLSQVNPALVAQLRRLSETRVQASKDFQKVARNIIRYKDQKAKKSVALNEAKFLKERAETSADKEEQKVFEKHIDQNNVGIERDYYLDEVMAIVVDYMNLQQVAQMNRAGEGVKN